MTANALIQDALAKDGHTFFTHAASTLISEECQSFDLYDAVHSFERTLLKKALAMHSGNQVKTAQFLQLSRRTLINKINRYALKTSS